MGFPKRYDPSEAEPRWQTNWAEQRLYEFDPADPRPIFAIDTPPPTVSGELHIGHVYSYTQAEAMARFWRMQGYNVYYPFGFDDNGLPTERFVEKRLGVWARELGRERFIDHCLAISREVEQRFEQLWKRLGFSVDWRLCYSTIDPRARRTAQWSFLDLYRKGLVYRAQSPNPWCIECQTAIAQAEMDDVERNTTFYTIAFATQQAGSTPSDGTAAQTLLIATTRPELLPACVAVFVHPADRRYSHLHGQTATVPLLGRQISILTDAAVDPAKGTGAVMCCTFGDATDVAWWQAHQLPLIPLLTRQGRLSSAGGPYAGLTLAAARQQITADLRDAALLRATSETAQTVRVHERCGTPLEILETQQWFIRVLDAKEALLEAGRRIAWHPAYMQTRYEHWVANLKWDWCISRQRYYGVPFPVWYCDQCGAILLADETQLPLDPTTTAPPRPCRCGNADWRPEEDVMDTWATSSVSPQIATQWLDDPALYARLFPMHLRPQAHDIVRTWAFYTIVKSHYHFGAIPWQTVMISGHGLAPDGASIHKSKGNSPIAPMALIERYGADATRYWACSGSTGADQSINEATMKQGMRLVNKLWNAARFIAGIAPAEARSGHEGASPPRDLLPSDRALLSWLQRLIEQATGRFAAYEYAAACDATERFFWGMFCDNYLEWVKNRLYEGSAAEHQAAQWTLAQTMLAVLKLFAPILPHITAEIYHHLFAAQAGGGSIHTARWPQPDPALIDPAAEQSGAALLALTGAVRRYKSAQSLSLGAALTRLTIATDADNAILRALLEQSVIDVRSVSRAGEIVFATEPGTDFEELQPGLWLKIE
jgi:valyl-tRNA synthetase